jgi:hypothetical protein
MNKNIANLALITCFAQVIYGVNPNYPALAQFPEFALGPSAPNPPLKPSYPLRPITPMDPGFLSGLTLLTSPLAGVTKGISDVVNDVPVLGTIVKGAARSLEEVNEHLEEGDDIGAVFGVLETVTAVVDNTAKGVTTAIGSPVHLDTVCVVNFVPHAITAYNEGHYVKSALDVCQSYEHCTGRGLVSHGIKSLGSYFGSASKKWIEYPNDNRKALEVFLKPSNPKDVSAEESEKMVCSYIPEEGGLLYNVINGTDLRGILGSWAIINALKTTPLLSAIVHLELPEDPIEDYEATLEELKNCKLITSAMDLGFDTDWPLVLQELKAVNYKNFQSQLVVSLTKEGAALAAKSFIPAGISSFASKGILPQGVSNFASNFGFFSKKNS